MRCPRINDSAFLSVPPKTPLFDALRILDLTDCIEIGDKAVEKIVATCPRLRNLLLAKCRHLTDRAVWAITKLGKNLHYLHLGHCTRLTDASIQALARSCTRIRYIDLACCSNLTDASITQLAANLPKLKRVGLVKCAGITDRSIHALATYGGRAPGKAGGSNSGVNVLERVHLSYCTLLTLDGIHTLLNNCPRLTHLSLTGVQAFLREDLTVYCREAPPEFNEHQRDVFCVFSGPGVHRLREHLNGIGTTNTPADGGSDEDGGPPPPPPHHGHHDHHHMHIGNQDAMDDEDLEDDGETTPVNDGDDGQDDGAIINVPVHSTPSNSNALPMGATIMANPSHGLQPFPMPNFAASTGPALWASGPAYQPQNNPGSVLTRQPVFGSGALHMQTQQSHQPGGGAQQVTGMMGAAMLDDIDDGEDTFGEDSEIIQ